MMKDVCGGVKARMLILACGASLMTGCVVWRTDSPGDDPVRKDGLAVSKRDGQPYFLPKAVLRLKVKVDTSVAEGAAEAEAEKKPVKVLGSRGGEIPAPDGQAPAVQKYKISLEKIIVPDREYGPLYAHYATNWAFSDTVGVKVGENQLLESLTAKTEDRTKESLDNLADAAVDVMKFQAAGGFGAAATPFLLGSMKMQKAGKSINAPQPPYIKQLDIDVTFDPFNPADIARVRALFDDDLGGQRDVFSPLKIRIEHKDNSKGDGLPDKVGKRKGLWFREPTTVEVVVQHNPDLSQHLKSILSDVHSDWIADTEKVRPAKREMDKAKKVSDAADKENEAAKTALATATKELADLEAKKKAASPPKDIDDLIAKAKAAIEPLKETAKTKLKAAEERKAEYQAKSEAYDDVGEPVTLKGQYIAQIEKMYFGSLPGEKARDQRMTLAVPNKQRAFSINVPRSAFIERTTDLTITDGVLLGIKHTKPSEIEGFTEIPKSLASKLAAIPKALVETKKDMFGAQKDALTNRNALVDQEIEFQKKQGSRDFVVETDRMTKEGALLNQRVSLIDSRETLREKEKAIAAKSLPQIQSDTEKLNAAKDLEDARAAFAKSSAARLTEEKNLLQAQRSYDEERNKATGSGTSGSPGNTTDPSKPAGQ